MSTYKKIPDTNYTQKPGANYVQKPGANYAHNPGTNYASQPQGLDETFPLSIANLEVWFRGDLGITVTGLGVSTWADQSGNGRNATQTTDARRPAYSATGGPQNRGYLTLDGTADWLFLNAVSTLFQADSPFTVVASIKKTATAASPLFMAGNSASGSPRTSLYLPVTPTQVRCDRVSDTGVAVNVSYNAVVATGNWKSVQWFSAGTLVNFRHDATTLTQTAQDCAPQTLDVATIGATRNSGFPTGAEFWAGSLWEFMVFSRELTSAERDSIYSYQLAFGAAG